LVDEFNNSTDAEWEEFQSKLQLLHADADDLVNAIDEVKSEEEDYYENMPENMQSGDKGSQAEDAISALQEAIDALEEIKNHDPDKPVLEDFDVVTDDIVGHLETALG
jgi:division protein CdvB (Snf7/Vps24/ESCRT-III family)